MLTSKDRKEYGFEGAATAAAVSCGGAVAMRAPAPTAPMVARWLSNVPDTNPKSGKTYYFNSSTQEI